MNDGNGRPQPREGLAKLTLEKIQELRRTRASRKKRLHSLPLVSQERPAILPLSYPQERMWFLDQLGLAGSTYNVPMALRLEGRLDVAALENSIAELIRRHEILRTRFESLNGDPVQVVDPPGPFVLEVHDVSGMREVDKTREMQRLSRGESQYSFDLARGPVLRALLLKFAELEHVLFVTVHHIATDGWSWAVLQSDLVRTYSALSLSQQSSLQALPIQYADFAIWQRKWLQGDRLQSQMRYWLEQLRGASPQLQLPTDRPRPAVESFRGAESNFELSANLSAAIKNLAQREGATLFMVSLAAFQILLSRWSGEQDILVGSSIAGRTSRELDDLIGCFVNMLVFRSNLSGEPTFRQLLGQVREIALDAYAHQDLPFEVLVKELCPNRNLSRQPIFQVALEVQTFSSNKQEVSGLKWSCIEAERATTHFDLTLHLHDTADGIKGEFEYATDLFDDETIKRMGGHYRTLLEGIVADPDCPIHQLPMLTAGEQQQLLVDWNQTAVDYARDELVHELFTRQAARTPEALALVQDERRLTFGEVEIRSNQLAHHLRALGVGPEVIVGLFMERSPELVIGLLGILKAGGAYLPLDPSYPSDRLQVMMQDSGSSILVTSAVLDRRLQKQAALLIRLDADWSAIARCPVTPPETKVTPHDLAYVIYTSGSTGTPKGVMVEHAGLLNYVQWALCTYEPQSGEGIPISSPLAFDATATSLYCALLSGRAAVLLTDGQELDALEKLIQGPEQWSLIKVSPAHLQALGPLLEPVHPPCTVNAIVTGGETLPPSTVEQWRSIWPRVRLINQYGPTETVVACTAYEIPSGFVAVDSVPIGRPVWNTQLYVLDAWMRPVPIGVQGELYIGGLQVGRGYLNRPELTEERFVDNPFGVPGSRLYRSGDLVRYLPDGNLEFRGRTDNQVKIRGYRIELGEVESVLLGHEGVRQAIVLAREDSPGERRLVAYIVRGPDHTTQIDSEREPKEQDCIATDLNPDRCEWALISQLREYLKGRLPAYMIPSAWMVLKHLPLTASGKVNRSALPKPQKQSEEMKGYIPPRSEVERDLAEIWAQILQVDRVGVRDNYFELGGHSLQGVKLISKVSERFLVRLPAIAVFQYPTVQEMAEVLESLKPAAARLAASHAGELERGVI